VGGARSQGSPHPRKQPARLRLLRPRPPRADLAGCRHHGARAGRRSNWRNHAIRRSWAARSIRNPTHTAQELTNIRSR